MNDHGAAEADSEFRNVRRTVLQRDDYKCRFCSFRALKWQEVHHRNNDHADNRPNNLVTACSFCHMVQHIGLAGKNNEAVLIWLPEIPQDRLHHIVRTILVANRWAEVTLSSPRRRPDIINASKEMSDASRSLFAKLRDREEGAVRHIGTSNALELANILLSMPDEAYDKRADFLRGVRLLPLGKRQQEGEDIMPKVIDSWMDAGGPYGNLKPSTWIGLLRSTLS